MLLLFNARNRRLELFNLNNMYHVFHLMAGNCQARLLFCFVPFRFDFSLKICTKNNYSMQVDNWYNVIRKLGLQNDASPQSCIHFPFHSYVLCKVD